MRRYVPMFAIVISVLTAWVAFISAAPKTRASGVNVQEQERRVKMKDLPAAVQKTVSEQSKGAVIRGLSQEIEDGKTYYEVELKVNGHNKDVLMDPTGAVVEIEEQVTLDSLPSAVKTTIVQNARGGKIGVIESITKGDTVEAYEAHVRRAGKSFEIKVNPDGQLISKGKD